MNSIAPKCRYRAYDTDGLLLSAGALTLARSASTGLPASAAVDGVATAYTYDSTGVVIGATTTTNGTPLYAYQRERDALDRIVRKVETVSGTTTDTRFAYDSAGRLRSVTRDGVASAAYEYDANGNCTRRTSSAGIELGVVDAQDRLTSYGGATYQYTDAGELTRQIASTDTTTYHYDAMGALRWVQQPNGTRIDYVIDAAGRRVGRKVNGALTQGFLYEGELRIAAELTPSGAVLSRFVYGTQVNVPEYMERAGTRYRLLTDHLGSVRLVVDATTGAVQQQLEYDEYGRVRINTNPGCQPFGYAGGLFDSVTGLVRFGARDYNAQAGRWTVKDPAGFDGADANMYRYASADPLNFMDPSGLRPLTRCEKQTLAPYIPGVDLGHANIHDDGLPIPALPDVVGMTFGNDIYFRENAYDSGSASGIALLGHELVHVGQYRRGELTIPRYVLFAALHFWDNKNSKYEKPAYKLDLDIFSDLQNPSRNKCKCE